jgi:uncharacterized protein (DUF2384 family)
MNRLERLFGSHDEAWHWLKTPRKQLGDLSPHSVLLTGDFQSVETLVYAIETGQPL